MNDNAIKNYAVWARRELMAEVEKRCAWWGIREGADAEADAIDGRVLSAQERDQRKRLLEIAGSDGQAQLVERAAYTWFNRLLAIRFMEVNDRLPSHVRVLSGPDGSFEPQCLREALDLPLDALDGAEALRLVQEGDDEALFRLVFLAQCDELARCMPAVFEPVGSAMELLLPTGLLRADGVVGRLVADIDEDDWREGVEIVGWMYQYYVSERKDEVFAGFKKGRKAERDSIAPATQLFTPHWIVRYLTENSLGRLWMLNHPESDLTEQMPYYVRPDDEHETEFRRISSPEEITVVDPACGSGHILVYAFDLLLQMYRESGYRDRDAVRSILERNLTGLEIDRRAAAMASFALTMKACEADGRFLRRGVTPRVTVLERVEFSDEELGHLPHLSSNRALLDAAAHLDECGSLLQVTESDMDAIEGDLASLAGETTLFAGFVEMKLRHLRSELAPLAARYDVVVANPPYMGGKNMNRWLGAWVKKNYPDFKGDLFSCFVERNVAFGADHAQLGFMTPYVWMFIGTYEKLRRFVIEQCTITSLIQLEYSGFAGATVPICTFTLQKGCEKGYRGGYIRLSDFVGADNQAPRVLEALADPGCGWFYRRDASAFEAIPGSPIAYWMNPGIWQAYKTNPTLAETARPKVGMQTSNNDKYLRLWWEITYSDFDGDSRGLLWIKYLKGGDYRKWYGNLDYLLHYNKDAEYILQQPHARVLDIGFLEKHKCTWTDLTSGRASFRYAPQDTFYDISGHCFFPNEDNQFFLLGYANTSLVDELKRVFNSSFHFQVGDLAKIVSPPFEIDCSHLISKLAKQCVELSKYDWDARETSWDFKKHLLI